MKLEVYKPVEPEPQPEQVVRLKLYEDHGRIVVSAVNRDGREIDFGIIAIITHEGLRRCSNLRGDLGFPLDERGRIQLV